MHTTAHLQKQVMLAHAGTWSAYDFDEAVNTTTSRRLTTADHGKSIPRTVPSIRCNDFVWGFFRSFRLHFAQWLRLVFPYISSSFRCNDSARNFLRAFRLHFVATAALPLHFAQSQVAPKCFAQSCGINISILRNNRAAGRIWVSSLTTWAASAGLTK